MSNNNNPNTHTALAQDQKVIAGIEKYFANVGSLTVAGTQYTPASLKALFQGFVDAINALDAIKAQSKQQVATTQASRAQARVLRMALRSYILGTYGAKAVQMLQDFGMNAPKPNTGRKPAKTMAQAVVKEEATREARHEMGSRQRQTIHGATVEISGGAHAPAETPAAAASANVTPSK